MMKLCALIATAAVLSLPAAARADDSEKKRSAEYSTKKICRTYTPIGSRLGGITRCRTKAEEAEHRRHSREVTERVQTGGNPRCRLPEMGGGCS